MLNSSILMLVACSGISQVEAKQDIDLVWFDRANKEVQISLEKYASLSRQIDETTELRTEKDLKVKDAKFRNRTIQMKVSQLDNNSTMETVTIFDDEKGKPTIRLIGRNEDYTFVLQKARLDSPYALLNYTAVKPGEHVGGTGGGYYFAFEQLPHVLKAVEARDGYVLKALRWDDPKQLLYISFHAKRGSPTKPFTVDEEVWLDPSNNWRVMEVKVRTPSLVTHDVMTYGQQVDGLSFPVQYAQTAIPSDPTKTSYHIRGTLNITKTNKSLLDFRLSAFGLPEPAGFPLPRRVPIYVWILVTAGACAIFAVVFRYLARRRHLHAVA